MPHPSTYTPERANAVVCRLSSGRSLESIGRDPDLPSVSTIRAWAKAHPDFAALLAAVRERGPRCRAEGGRRWPIYSEALAAGVCAALAAGFSLKAVCGNPVLGISPNTVWAWARARPDFAARLAEATRPRQTPRGLRIGRGRRGAYTPQRAAAVIDALVQGRPLSDIVRDPDMPSGPVIREWRRRRREFDLMMQTAQRFQLALLFEHILAAADRGETAAPERAIASGLIARGTQAFGTWPGWERGVVVVAEAPRAEGGKRRRGRAPGIGHNSRGR